MRGREPEVTIEDVAEQTGLSQASIRQYVLAAWRRRLGAGPAGAASGQGDVAGGSSGSSGSGSSGGSGEEGEEREGMWRAPAAAASRRRGATSRASRADEPVAVAAGVERRREEQGSSGVGRGEEEEGAGNDDEEEETTAAATTSDVSSESTSSADSQVSPPSASARRRVEEEEEGDVVVEGQLLLVVQEEEEDGDASGSGSSSSSGSGNSSDEESAEEEEALRSIDFRRMKDHLVRARPGYDSGSTAVVALLLGREALVVANAGDSRCVLSRGGKALDLSQDHKPDNPLELARIRAAGGSVAEGRVEGNLNLSRAIGDLTYKDAALAQARQMITAQPEVCTLALEAADDFVVLACDGIWNVLSSQEVVDHVSAGIAQGRALSALCEELCDRVSPRRGLGWGVGGCPLCFVDTHTHIDCSMQCTLLSLT